MIIVDEITSAPARLAVYDDLLSSPRIIDISPAPVPEFIEAIASVSYEKARAQGGALPYTVIREIAENFIHADFKECTVSILNSGNTIRFSDQGPGIDKKELVLQPGISSATASMKQYIRGVGSGFPIVREYLERVNGLLTVGDNAIDGTVITLSVLPQKDRHANTPQPVVSVGLSETARLEPPHPYDGPLLDSAEAIDRAQSMPQVPPEKAAHALPSHSLLDRGIRLKPRDERVLLLLYEEGLLGSGDLVEPLNVSAPTATRILQHLEELGLVELSMNKKRILSNKGLAYVQALGQQQELGGRQ